MKGTLASWKFLKVSTFSHSRVYIPTLLFFLVFTFLVGVVPAVKHILNDRERLLSIEGDVRALTTKKNSLKELVPELVKTQVEIATRALPHKPEFITSAARIQQAAQSAGVNILLLNFDAPSEVSQAGIQAGEMRVDVEGQPSNIMAFMTEIEQSLPFMRVTNGRLSTGGGISQVSLKVHSFWQKIPDRLPQITEPLGELSSDELNLLSQLQGFKEVQYREKAVPSLPSSLTSPAPVSPRSNPFSF